MLFKVLLKVDEEWEVIYTNLPEEEAIRKSHWLMTFYGKENVKILIMR